MKLFECQNCGHPLYFENVKCESCGLRLGYLPTLERVSSLQADGERWRALASPQELFRFCANARYEVCNWMIPADSADQYCAACRHNRTIPDLLVPGNQAHWRMIEVAKHRLFYTLIKLRLPLATRAEEPDGLAFDFIATAAPAAPVMTGHASGLVTINLAEADDAVRERTRNQMGEPYRTLLGHFRHESAHYYWSRLIENSNRLQEFRDLFGDEQQDYAEIGRAHV